MDGLRIDDALVRWAVDGRAASAEAAVAALAERPLLLLMHGYGSFEGDLIELSSRLPAGFVCASPRAPLVAPPPVVDGYAWWQIALDEHGLRAQVPAPADFVGGPEHRAASVVLDWLDALGDRVADRSAATTTTTTNAAADLAGLGTIALMGFSQGGALVTSLLRLRPGRFACGVNCSGFVAAGRFAGDEELARIRPPMFWGRDEADPVIDAERIALTRAWAPAHTELDARLYDGILHGIGAEELADVSAFLARHVPEAAR